jgi:hypothetical protein
MRALMMRITSSVGSVRYRDNTLRDGPDGKESVLVHTVLFVVDHEVVRTALEQHRGLVEAQTMLDAVRAILRGIPLDPHRRILSHWHTKSMGDNPFGVAIAEAI